MKKNRMKKRMMKRRKEAKMRLMKGLVWASKRNRRKAELCSIWATLITRPI